MNFPVAIAQQNRTRHISLGPPVSNRSPQRIKTIRRHKARPFPTVFAISGEFLDHIRDHHGDDYVKFVFSLDALHLWNSAATARKSLGPPWDLQL